MKLSKKVPSRTRTLDIDWISKWSEMSQRFRDIRGKVKPCYWCKHHFEDGEVMYLGCVTGKGNKVFCESCATLAKGTSDG